MDNGAPFNFNELANGEAEKRLKEQFAQSGEDEVESNVDPRIRRTSGVSFKTINLVFADGQTVALDIKQTGDIFAVRLNGKPLPIRAQDTEPEAIAEIVKAMDAGRARFQAMQVRTKVQLPPSIRTPVPKQEIILQQAHAELDKQIEHTASVIEGLKKELAALPALDDVSNYDPQNPLPDMGDKKEADVLIQRSEPLDDGGYVPTKTEAVIDLDPPPTTIDVAAQNKIKQDTDEVIEANQKQNDDLLKPFEGVNIVKVEDPNDEDQLRLQALY